MKKKEIIWRHILYETQRKRTGANKLASTPKTPIAHNASTQVAQGRKSPEDQQTPGIFTQKALAAHFGFSTCTVFNALKVPRKIGAVQVTGRFFKVRDVEKLLLLWATHRNLRRDIRYATRVEGTVLDIEGSMPESAIFGAFSAYRLANNDAPADYDTLYIYAQDVSEIKRRFPKAKGRPNLIVLEPDPFLSDYGQTTPDVQTFVDIWNIPDWYGKPYLDALKERIFPAAWEVRTI